MSTSFENLKRHLFWIVARPCFAAYHWFPVFGTLRASIAIIYRDGNFLMIERNDGRGISLPGGISLRKEPAVQTLHREVFEETGLTVIGERLKLTYFTGVDVPCDVSVFEVVTSGDLKTSWEGSPRWMTVKELTPRLLESQRPVVKLLVETIAGQSGA